MRMRLILLLGVAFAAACAQVVQIHGQTAPDPEATLKYIHASWDSLTRAMTDCHSLVDPKVAEPPVLYFPVRGDPTERSHGA